MTALARVGEVREGELTEVSVDGVSHLLTQVGDAYYALENRCPHMGWGMGRGTVVDGVITCPWHGSRFEVCSGKNLDWVSGFAGIKTPKWSHRLIALGKKPAPMTSIELVVDGDDLRLP